MEHGQLTSDVRRWAAAITLVGLAVTVFVPSPAFAKEPKSGEKLCEVSDPKLGELSGLAARDSGYAAIGDGSDGNITTVSVVGLDDKCGNAQNGAVGQVEPSDPEDLAVDGDGNFWVADTGDNSASRPSIAVHKISADGQTATYRFTYPDNKAVDCEAMLLSGGTPIFATKEIGKSTLYKPSGELNPDAPVSLEKVGSVSIDSTETEGGPEKVNGIPLGEAPSMFVTGGAVSPDGKKAVLRTYTDAYEWKIKDKDVGKSISDGKPAVTPLPKEPQGEAITYSSDGKKFVTGSEAKVDDNGNIAQNPTLWSYEPKAAKNDSDSKKDDKSEREVTFVDWILDTFGPDGILWIVAGIGVIGLIMVLVGLRVIFKARRKPNMHSLKSSLDGGDSDNERSRYRDEDDGLGGGRLFEPTVPGREDGYAHDEPRSGSVYGGRDEPGSGTVYGGGGRDEPRSGSVYGGRDEPGSGTVYGGGGGRR